MRTSRFTVLSRTPNLSVEVAPERSIPLQGPTICSGIRSMPMMSMKVSSGLGVVSPSFDFQKSSMTKLFNDTTASVALRLSATPPRHSIRPSLNTRKILSELLNVSTEGLKCMAISMPESLKTVSTMLPVNWVRNQYSLRVTLVTPLAPRALRSAEVKVERPTKILVDILYWGLARLRLDMVRSIIPLSYCMVVSPDGG